MGAQSLLDQLLRSGRSALDGATQAAREAGRSGDLGKYATGAAVGGVLGLLLGSDSGRRLGGKALKLGSVAAIGALAWKAYQDHQAAQRDAAVAPAASAPPAAIPPSSAARLPAPQPEQHGRALLKALIAAAKSDGHMDERERGLVQAELERLEGDPELRRWFDEELRRPVDPAEVAAAASTPELAAEIYLASLIVVDARTTMERSYLDELARGLNLAPGLKADLEARAAAPA